MRTESLINALVADSAMKPLGLGPGFTVAIACGIVLASAIFFTTVGFRDDLAQVFLQARVVLKIGLAGTLATAAAGLAFRLVRPGTGGGGWLWMTVAVPVVLIAACLIELSVMPRTEWAARSVGTSAALCLTAIPSLAVAPLGCLLVALRRGAAIRPGLAGGVAGLAASAMAASLYATSCPDDSPLFMALWYPLACLGVACLGGAAGRWSLRW